MGAKLTVEAIRIQPLKLREFASSEESWDERELASVIFTSARKPLCASVVKTEVSSLISLVAEVGPTTAGYVRQILVGQGRFSRLSLLSIRHSSTRGKSQWYRIVRVYDTDDRSCRVYIYRTETPGEQSGVPYELSGESPHPWVTDELQEPTDGNTDWSMYRGTMPI